MDKKTMALISSGCLLGLLIGGIFGGTYGFYSAGKTIEILMGDQIVVVQNATVWNITETYLNLTLPHTFEVDVDWIPFTDSVRVTINNVLITEDNVIVWGHTMGFVFKLVIEDF